MLQFIYHDNKKSGEIIFTVMADTITEADKKFLTHFGYDVTKNPYIGCEVKKVGNNC